MNYYIKRIKEIPFHILINKLFKRVSKFIYHKYRSQVIKKKPILINSDQFVQWNSDMKFFSAFSEKKIQINLSNKENSEILKQADKVCDHVFNLLGSGDKQLGPTIKWNQDFKSGFIWENNYYKYIKTVNFNNNADIKVPFELSRFQHIPILGQAHKLSSDQKYIDEFRDQIEDWIEKNPVEMSVNWTFTMDTSIRACNWIAGAFYFREEINDSKFWEKYNKSLFIHGDFIFKNLDKGTINNNHYLSNLVGLIWLGIYFNNLNYENEKSKKWLDFAIKELEIEMDKQIFSDGFDYESSTAYHCMVTEFLLYTLILCDFNDIEILNQYKIKVEKMCEIIMNIIKPNGLIPIIGDMDNGRLIMFSGYGSDDMRDFRYLLGVAGEYFKRTDFKKTGNNNSAIWMFPNLIDFNQSIEQPTKSASYPIGGIYTLRSDDVYMIIRCGQNGLKGIGNHAHNDQLSFELNFAGEDFIVDPGTYLYTADYKMRNLFRSTKMHNTIKVGNLEQNDFYEKILFSLENQTHARVIEHKKDYFAGEHYGFKEKAGVIHKREIKIINSDEITLEDYLINGENHISYLYFHISPGISLTKENTIIIMKSENREIKIYFDSVENIEIIDSNYSKAYGYIENNKTIVVTAKNKTKIKTKFSII